jgi:hypothetical protein
VTLEEVKGFLRQAYYARFGLRHDPEFVETHPGGGAVGVRLSQYRLLPDLIAALEEDGGRRTEDGGRRAEDGCRMPDDG